MSVSGHYAYIANDDRGLRVMNVTDPKYPTVLGTYNSPGLARAVWADGRYAYLGDAGIGLHVVNVTNPMSPTKIGTCTTNGTAYGVFVEGHYAYVAEGTKGLRVINVTDPRNPTLVGTCATTSATISVWVAGHYAYVTDSSYGLQVVNVTDPRHPILLSSSPMSGTARGVCVQGQYAYVACDDAGLRVYNVTNPKKPVGIGWYDTLGHAYKVWVAGRQAYVADYDQGLAVVNVTDPRHLTFLGGLNIAGSLARGVVVAGDHAYLADESYGLVVAEVQRNRCRQCEALAIAQSVTVFTATGSASLARATLTCTQSLPSSTTIAYYLSPDAGAHWEAVTAGVEHVFINVGHQLKWRAVLITADTLQTPTLTSLAITYKTCLDAPILISPGDGVGTNDNKPTLQWTPLTGAANYLLQVDTVITFNSGSLRNVTVPGGTTSYTPILSLADGTWYWRVAAIDSAGDLGYWCTYRTLLIDTAEPTWDQTPTDLAVEFGSGFRYDLNASDVSGIDHYSVNDTSHFAIDGVGLITNKTALSVGVYGLEVRAYDPYTNYCTAKVKITVHDSQGPTWVIIPSDQLLIYGQALKYQLQAWDLSGIDHWSINDTVHFAISSAGLITNASKLAVGHYGLTVTAYDPYSNPRSASLSIVVQAQTTTTTTTTTTVTSTTSTTAPPGIPFIIYLGIGLGAVVAIIIVILLRRKG